MQLRARPAQKRQSAHITGARDDSSCEEEASASASPLSWGVSSVSHSSSQSADVDDFDVDILPTQSAQSISDADGASDGPDSEGGAINVSPEPWKTQFDSWEALDAYITAYGTQSYQGKRQRQESRQIECSVKINACVQVVSRVEPTFAVCITKTTLQHNHPLDKRTFRQYSHNRMKLDEVELDTINSLRKAVQAERD
ncbi:Hypothetical protein PHPALM_7317 [Phytophthora palmivora]|uniref:FAR1 domain-containing protein n=1 Tax=Phytophthora palmivora TaxID=4796 RepID=A0A2P4YCN6_9STRA|nr:Hypothetical protein PHPALM_7317 [Phytophthora palmivora]